MASNKQQEALFVVAEQSGQIAERSFEEQQFASVSLAERAVRLQNVVDSLAELNGLRGFVESESYNRYGNAADVIEENSRNKISRVVSAADEEFKQASGHYALIASGMPEWKAKHVTKAAYSEFISKFAKPKNGEDPKKFRKKVNRFCKKMATNAEQLLSYDWPEFAEPEVTVVSEDTAESKKAQEEKLTNFQKLEVLVTDPRAQFLPMTNREKTSALTWLSYLDNPGGIAVQLLEVYNKAMGVNKIGPTGGVRAIESIVYESADFATDAAESIEHLQELQTALGYANPKLKLDQVDEAVGLQGYLSLLRYSIVKRFYGQKPVVVPSPKEDPLRTYQDRWTKQGEGKHKKVHDRITHLASGANNPELQEELNAFLTSMSVAEGRKLLVEALQNEQAREGFFSSRLIDVSALATVNPMFKEVAETAVQLSGTSHAA